MAGYKVKSTKLKLDPARVHLLCVIPFSLTLFPVCTGSIKIKAKNILKNKKANRDSAALFILKKSNVKTHLL